MMLVVAIPMVAIFGIMASPTNASCGSTIASGPTGDGRPTGGKVRDAGGGVFVGGKWHYAEDGGPKWTAKQVAAKAEEYGLPGRTFAQIARAESAGYHPFIVQHNPGDDNVGFGFFQFTPHAWGPDSLNARKLKSLGGQKGLEDIDKQFEMARFMYVQSGNSISQWYGTQYVTNWSTPPVTKPLPKGASTKSDLTAATCSTADPIGKLTLVGLPDGAEDWLAPVPGTTAICDKRIIADLSMLLQRYKMKPGDCFRAATPDSPHAVNGEHPLGLGVDLVPDPAQGGTWDDMDRAAAWAEPTQNAPRKPFRWVGYNGDPNHGRGNHLHLSWDHSPAAPGTPAAKVWTLGT